MPLYDFIDTETGEEFELMLKIAEREEFLKDNPNVKQKVSAPMIVGGVDGLRKVDDGFNEVLQKIGEQNKEIAELKAKLDTKARLLDEALQRIKDIHDDSTEKTDTHADDQDLD